jgi:murein L,D-transpeptidase YafK
MRRWAQIAIILACVAAAPAQAAPPPESARSQAVEARISARLDADMRTHGLRLGAPIFLRITKQPATLSLFVAGAAGRFVLYKTYPICAFSGALGPKVRAGDGQAPEGFYEVPATRMNPSSQFHLSFDLGYPNAYDRA